MYYSLEVTCTTLVTGMVRVKKGKVKSSNFIKFTSENSHRMIQIGRLAGSFATTPKHLQEPTNTGKKKSQTVTPIRL